VSEIWKPIPGFPGYEVSNEGRVRSYRARGGGGNSQAWHISSSPQRILRAGRYDGYPFVHLMDQQGKKRTFKVHKLVMLAFVGPAPEGMEVCHNDGSRDNNRLENLRYDTRKGNAADIDWSRVEKKRRFSALEVLSMRVQRAAGAGLAELARRYGVTRATISDICRRRTYRDIGGPRTGSPRQKLSDADLESIRRRLGKVRQRDLAREYGVSDSLISRIKTGTRRA